MYLGRLIGRNVEYWEGLQVPMDIMEGVTIGKEYNADPDNYSTFRGDNGKLRTVSAWDFTFDKEREEIIADSKALVAIANSRMMSGPLSDDPLVNPKKAMGAQKAPMHSMPITASIAVENVLAGGGYKYGYMNYRESGVDALTYIGAIKRHFLKWQDGIDFDTESLQHELAHVMACCAIMIDAHHTGKLIDNRSKTGKVEALLAQSEKDFEKFMKKHDKKMLAKEKRLGNESKSSTA
jgi:hypothetical protein